MILKKPKKILSIDIGTSAIKVLLTTGVVGTDFDILDYRYIQTNTTGKPISTEDAVTVMKVILEELKGQYHQVRTTVSGNDVIVRIIEIQNISANELKKVLGLQLERFIPMKPSEVVFDCSKIEDENVRAGFQKCILIATPKKKYNNFMNCLDKISVNPILVDSEPTAVINTYLAFGAEYDRLHDLKYIGEEGIGILHLGASHTDMMVLKGQLPVMIRPINTGIIALINVVMSNYDMSYQEATEMIATNILEDEKLAGYVMNYLDSLIREAKTSLEFCRREFDIKIERIYLTGGVVRNATICDMLSTKLGIEVYGYIPFENIPMTNMHEKRLDFKLKAHSFLPALGLAIRELDI